VHASGDEFPLPASGEAVVGRADPVKGYQPDVVLSSLDAQRSLSRRHARIVREGDEFFLVDLPGYGYARVPTATRDGWDSLIAWYLSDSGNV